MLRLHLIVLFFVTAIGFALAADLTKVTAGDFSFQLPFGWHQVPNAKAAFTALPSFNDGRLVNVVIEKELHVPDSGLD